MNFRKKYTPYFKIIGLILIFVAIVLFIPSVNAAQTMNSSVIVDKITDTTITFNVTYKTTIRATGATFDGVAIEGYDLNHNVSYTATKLEPNTTHTFCIYKDLINCETATTLPNTDPWFNIGAFIGLYILFIAGLICLYIGLFESMIGFGATVFGLVLIITGFNNSFVIGTLGGILVIASIFVVFKGKN